VAEHPSFRKPPVAELGQDLLKLTRRQMAINLSLPFAFCGAYFLFAALGWWPAGALLLVLSAVAADAVHRVMASQRERLWSLSAGHAQLVGRLRASLQSLAESNRLKDDFVAAVSHELRSPLTSIQGSLSTLLRDDVALDPATARSLLEVADRQSRRLRRLVEDLLVVSMPELGEDRPRLGEVRLDVLVDHVLEDLGADGGHLVEVDLPATLAPVRSDADRLHQILANLVGNARKYAPAGSTITVRARPGRSTTDVLVADQGPGVPAELGAKVFEPFVTTKQDGVGLGLALTKRIVEDHGGTIGYDAAPVGTTFWIELPNV